MVIPYFRILWVKTQIIVLGDDHESKHFMKENIYKIINQDI